MQRYTFYLYLGTALHVLGGTSTQHQERIQLYLQHLLFVTPLLLFAAIVQELDRFECAVGGVHSNSAHTASIHHVTGDCMCRIRRLLMMGASARNM
jgi:hypothetical protein